MTWEIYICHAQILSFDTISLQYVYHIWEIYTLYAQIDTQLCYHSICQESLSLEGNLGENLDFGMF